MPGDDDIISSTKGFTKEEIINNLKIASPERLLFIAEAFRSGLSVDDVNSITYYDPWFLKQIEEKGEPMPAEKQQALDIATS